MPGGAPKVVNLGPLPERATVRVGVLPKGVPTAPVTVVVSVGEEEVGAFVAADPRVWADRRIALDAKDAPKGECRIVFRSSKPFCLGPCELVRGTQSKCNVLIVLIDTLRQDHLGCYGYPRNTSPHIDALRKDGVLFPCAVPQSSWTRPSVASLLTCCYPSTHGASDRDSVMRAGMPTVAEALRAAGYETHAFMSNPTCMPVWGIGNEFDRVLDTVETELPNSDDRKTIDAVIATLRCAAGRPWFFYVHLMGPHKPYAAFGPYGTMFESPEVKGTKEERHVQQLLDAYDGEIAYTDAQIGRLAAELRTLGLYEHTLIVLLSDHGEQFYEHGAWGHGESLHVEELSIPLLMKLPDSAHARARYEPLVEVVDVGPTILDALDVRIDSRFQGRSFWRGIEGQVLGEHLGAASLLLEKKSMYMAQSKEAKFIHDLVAQQRLWFDLAADPREQHPSSQPIAGAGQLERYAARVATLGAQGLNILITAGNGEVAAVSGVVRGNDIEGATVHYHAGYYEVQNTQGVCAFAIRLEEGKEFARGAEYWYDVVKQDSARVHVPIGPDAEITLGIQADGKPVPPSDVFLGGARINPPTVTGTIKPSAFGGHPHAFDPCLLPRRFAVYVWYVPPVDTVQDEELDSELRAALQGLGYLD